MSYAIYFIAVGDSATKCLKLAYHSLRRAGFSNDIYILCDRDEVPFAVSDNTKVLKIRDEHLNLNEHTDKPLSFFDVRRLDKNNPRNARSAKKYVICHMKSLVDEYVSMEQYTHVLYLDVDVLTAGPQSVFDDFLLENKGKVITATAKDGLFLGGRGNFSLRRLRRALTTVAANLTTWELLKYWFVRPICADIVCFPTDNKRFLNEWKKECQKGIDSDQAALQAILLRSFRNVHLKAPYSVFGYGPKHYQYVRDKRLERVNSVFVHFGGAIKDPEAFELYYDRYLAI